MLHKAPVIQIRVVPDNERKRDECSQLNSVNLKLKNYGKVARLLMAELTIESRPCPLPGLSFQGRGIESAAEIGIDAALGHVNAEFNDVLVIGVRESMPQDNAVAARLLPKRSRIKQNRHRIGSVRWLVGLMNIAAVTA